MNVMLIDDDEICMFITKIVLQNHEQNFNVVSYLSANDALQHLESQTDISSFPDLILLDLNMPSMNGFGFLEKLNKNNSNLLQLKICVLTSSDNTIDKQRAMNYSSVLGFVEKPISSNKLSDILTKINTLNLLNESANFQ